MKTNVTILAFVLGIVCLQSASAQSFKQVKVGGNAKIVQVDSGGSSVWALASNGHPYIYNGKSFVSANTVSLDQLAVGGGNAVQPDAVWGATGSGNIYQASKNKASWIFTQVPGSLDLIRVGPGYHDSCHPYEVWGINFSLQILRYNYCSSNWEQQQEPEALCDVQVGGDDVWAAGCGPNVYQFDFPAGVFNQISDPFGAFPVLAASTTGLWAIDSYSQEVYQYDVFTGFQAVISCCSSQISAGGNGVWILSGSNILRLNPNTTYYAELSVPGSPDSISVGTGGGVWVVNNSNQVFAFSNP
jgi:hypothetical protein